MISQDYFDEMCLENAELFDDDDDATEEQAVQATLEQLQMTMTTTNSSNNNHSNNSIRHLVTSFPTSPHGIQQRRLVAEFLQALQEIQKAVVTVKAAEAEAGNDNDHSRTLDGMDMRRILELIHRRIFSLPTSTLAADHEKDDDNDDDAVNDVVVDRTVYMALFTSSIHDGFGLYLQLWYCWNNTNTADTPRGNDCLYRLLWSTLVRVLLDNDNNQPKRHHPKDQQQQRRQVQSLYQTSFSTTPIISLWLQTVDQKLLALLQYQQNQQQQIQNDDQNAAAMLLMFKLVLQDLQHLFTLAYYCVKQCEANKKAFMSVSIVVSSTTISGAATSARRVHLVPVVLESLDRILAQLQHNVDDDDNSSSSNARGGTATTEEQHSLRLLLAWTRDIGRLITALDTFDDFSGGATTNTTHNSSSAGVVSCGHDHVQAWKNARAMDKLHALLVEILKRQPPQQRQPEPIDCPGQQDDQQVTAAMTTTTTRVDAGDAEVSDAAAAAAAIVLALRSMAIQDDVVQAMVAIGVLETATQILLSSILSTTTNHHKISTPAAASLELLSAVMGLVRNLCANDEIKTNLCLGSVSSGEASTMKSSIVPGIVHAMQQYRLQQVLKKDQAPTTTTLAAAATLQEHAIGTLAAMALRKPFNSDLIVRKCYAHVDILQAMRDYPQKTTLQRQGALCIRNLASRAWTMSSSSSGSNNNSDNTDNGNDNDEDHQDLRTILLQADAATVLRETAAKHLRCQDEVYAALRDLGVPNVHFTVVHLDSAQSTATTSGCANDGGLTTFGQGHNRNFRPVQDEST